MDTILQHPDYRQQNVNMDPSEYLWLFQHTESLIHRVYCQQVGCNYLKLGKIAMIVTGHLPLRLSRLLSSEMLRRVVWYMLADNSEERSMFIRLHGRRVSYSTLKMKAVCSSVTSVSIYQTARSHRRENLKLHISDENPCSNCLTGQLLATFLF